MLVLLVFASLGALSVLRCREARKGPSDARDHKSRQWRGIRDGFVKEADPEFCKYESALKGARNPQEKWRLTKRFLLGSPSDPSGPEMPVEERIKANIQCPSPLSEIWVQFYPEIARQVRWSAADLRMVAAGIGSRGVEWWCSELSWDELARRWVGILTGLQFQDWKAFREWFERNRLHLRWDAAAGTFRITEEADGATDIPGTA